MMPESLVSSLAHKAPSSILACVAVAVFLRVIYSYVLHPLFFSPLRDIPPAHPAARFTPYWISYHRRNGSQALKPITLAHATHGPIIRLSPTEISVASYEGACRIYIERGGFAKPEWWANEFKTFGVRNMVSKIGGVGDREHRARKRDLGPVYSKTFLVDNQTLRGIAGSVLGRLTEGMERVVAGKEGGVLEVYNFNGAVNADFISAYQFGPASSFSTNYTQDVASRIDYFKNHDAFLNDGLRGAKTWLENLVAAKCEKLAAAEKNGTTDDDSRTHAVVYNQLRSRGLQGEDVASELLDHLMAGAEAPRSVLTYVQWEVSKNPHIQAQLRNEVQSLLPSHSSISSSIVPPDFKAQLRNEVQSLLPSHSSISSSIVPPDFKALDALPLLDAVLTETLRVYTPTPGPQHRLTPPEGTTLHGHFIPGGTRISACLGTLHRNADVFAEPEVWVPERWLTEDKVRLEEMRRWFWAFNKGSRGCVGKDFTVIVMKLIIATLYARYETHIVEDDGMAQADRLLAQPEGERLVLRFKKVA